MSRCVCFARPSCDLFKFPVFAFLITFPPLCAQSPSFSVCFFSIHCSTKRVKYTESSMHCNLFLPLSLLLSLSLSSVFISLSHCISLCFCSYGTSTSRPPKTPCLATLSQSTTAVSPLMTLTCPLPPTTGPLR